ncbi:zinc ABC transporter substrate-binding protein [Sporosarcina thermotolerans]|uniref:Zinc ABC transporter substrate-binding protein n=1 Tax=Sporosarcina thermotolerans TaxID=633404 RepID=A0AAW9A729_9BACL|nr:zinc ABC transporter substrate-binding protein [Sporosarcina thermotolerans]MDW0116044.1 zinc ABC transporter substrate-binding protein [Sporosarcina thermotolerans]WHT49775.1 zinc ABC transporter substrate-binding protein [Sporosarcina thermotolerans]
MNKKLLIPLMLILTLLVSACGNKDDNGAIETKNRNTLSVYTTVYPLQYFTERIGGEFVDVHSIYPVGADEHSFDPTQKDMIALSDADLFFYIGLGLEGFVENAQKTLKGEHVELVATGNSISDDQLKEGSHEEHEDEDHDHGHFDPHVWISPKLSIELAASIKESLIAKMPDQEESFSKNFSLLEDDLIELDERFKELSANAKTKTFFVSHAAFGYIANEYGLTQVAIAGLNSQSEPSQKQLTQIVEQAKEEQIHYILFEQNVSSKLTEVVRKEIGAESLTLHNLGVLTQEDVKNNETYFTLMERNLRVLEQALSGK